MLVLLWIRSAGLKSLCNSGRPWLADFSSSYSGFKKEVKPKCECAWCMAFVVQLFFGGILCARGWASDLLARRSSTQRMDDSFAFQGLRMEPAALAGHTATLRRISRDVQNLQVGTGARTTYMNTWTLLLSTSDLPACIPTDFCSNADTF